MNRTGICGCKMECEYIMMKGPLKIIKKIFAYKQFNGNILVTNQSLRKELHMPTKKKAKKKTAKKK
jgi:hypothetical protein